MFRDVRYALRVLLKNIGFTTVAVLSLALGVGANTAIFSMINSLLFSPLPAEDAKRLVSVFTTDVKNPGPLPSSHYNYKDYRDNNDVFTDVLAYNFATVNLNKGDGESRQLFGEVVTANYFDVLGVKPYLGRTFYPDEDKTLGANPIAVLSYGCWQRDFAADKSLIGQTCSLNRQSFTVIGIAPSDFSGTDIGGSPDLWVPMSMHRELQPDLALFYDGRRGLAFNVIGRLKPGVTLQQAQASMSSLASNLEREYPKDNEGRSVMLVPLLQARTDPTGNGQLTSIFLVLMLIVGIVLLIACANVTNLLLARATKRTREIAIRMAIGASRGRLIRQLISESLVLSLIGGALGVLTAHLTRNVIASLLPLGFGGPNQKTDVLDWRVLLFALGISAASGIVFGLVPALHSSRPDLVMALKGDVTIPVGRQALKINLRACLVTLQVALSLFALVTAGLFVRSLQKASQVDPGFITSNAILIGFNFGREGYTEPQARQFHRQLLERVRAMPGVVAATIERDRPVGFGFMRSVFIEGQDPASGGKGVLVQTNDIGANYFETLGIPLINGRDFWESDNEMAPHVVIINEAMAKRFFPNDDALGKRFKFFGDPDFRQIVGIARDCKVTSLVESRRPLVYIPLQQEYSPQVTLHVRTGAQISGMVASLQNEIHQLDASLSLLNVQTVEDRLSQSLQAQRSQATLLGTAGVLALILSAIGVYGVMAYSVAQRTREIGIRMALGAGKGQVMSLMLKQAGIMVSAGVAIGLVAAVLVTGITAGSLFGISPRDPLTLLGSAAILIVVSLLATLIPARRALKVDPMVALRWE